ncbi:MAG: hypothetical protein ACWA5X_02590 [bacterium]
MIEAAPIIKQREIGVRGPCGAEFKADGMLHLLSDVEGVCEISKKNEYFVNVSYDLLIISLEQLETALSEVGFHLDNSLLTKLKRAFHYYSEETQRANLGLGKLTCQDGCAIKVFVKHYQARQHGCRDHRPDHFKRYL